LRGTGGESEERDLVEGLGRKSTTLTRYTIYGPRKAGSPNIPKRKRGTLKEGKGKVEIISVKEASEWVNRIRGSGGRTQSTKSRALAANVDD